MTTDKQNIMHNSLVPHEKNIFPPLHRKLGIIKQFVKSLKMVIVFLPLSNNHVIIIKIKLSIFVS